jgi:hypothetical protein
MRRLLLLVALALVAAGYSSPARALSPEDAIYLTQQGVGDEVIIAKICADAEGWDLTSDEIAYLREKGVSREVVEALIDPAGAAERYGFTLGNPNARPESHPDNYGWGTPSTSLVFSLGYYYGPLGVHYFYDPYFYPYYCSPGWAFSFGYWPAYYQATYFPYHCGYYPYPYYWYTSGYYCGYKYYGPAYPYYCPAPLPASYEAYVKAPVRYRDYAYTNPPPAYGSDKPNSPEQRLGKDGRAVLDQYARDARRGGAEVIRGDQRSTQAIGGVDRRSQQVVRGGQKSVGRGTAAEKYLASRDATRLGRGTSRDAVSGTGRARVLRPGSRDAVRSLSGTDRVRVLRPGSRDAVRSVGGGSVGSRRTSVGAPGRIGTPKRGATPSVIRGGRSQSPRAVSAPSRGSSSGGGKAALRSPSTAPTVRSAPAAGVWRGGGATAAPRGGSAARSGGGGAGGGGRGR